MENLIFKKKEYKKELFSGTCEPGKKLLKKSHIEKNFEISRKKETAAASTPEIFKFRSWNCILYFVFVVLSQLRLKTYLIFSKQLLLA